MPKLKTRKSVEKRFRRTATGKIKRESSFAGHKLSKKTSKRKRNLRKSTLVDSNDLKRIRKMLGI